MSLHSPPPNVQRWIISSPSTFTDEYECSDFSVTHAWPSSVGGGQNTPTGVYGSSTYRTFLCVSFTVENEIITASNGQQLIMPQTFEWVGDVFCSILSVFYGKRFDNHGCLQTRGHITIPRLENIPQVLERRSATSNTKPRKDVVSSLELSQIGRIQPLLRALLEDNPSKQHQVAYNAASLYLQGIHLLEERLDLSYVNLVAAGELIASNFGTFTDEELFDPQTLAALQEISEKTNVANLIRGRLRQLSRRFRLSLKSLLTQQFFDGGEPNGYQSSQLSLTNIDGALSAAYSLRSRYMHSGQSFGAWVRAHPEANNELSPGTPVVSDREYGKLLEAAPTIIGIERIIRYAILGYIHRETGSGIDDRLAANPTP